MKSVMQHDIFSYVRPNILSLAPYSTARDDYKGGDISVWLDANESPYENGVNRYPDPHQKALKTVLSEFKDIPMDQIFVGNGSDEAIDLVFRIFCRPGIDNAIAIAPSYGMYAVAAAINNVALREVQLNENFSLPLEKMLAMSDERTKLMWVCSPNNPTGNAFPREQLESLADSFDGMLVVDEAYVDFSDEGTLLDVLHRHQNLIVLQTLSKAWGMAGLRLGMAFASPVVINLFAQVKYPYNINAPTQTEIIRRLREDISGQIAEIKEQRQLLAVALSELPCIKKVYPTDANFLLVRVDDANFLYDVLVSKGIIVRNRAHVKGCEGCVRITIGTPKENLRLIETLQQL